MIDDEEATTRDGRLEVVAEILATAAGRMLEISNCLGAAGRLMREEALSMQLLGVAMEIRALIDARAVAGMPRARGRGH